MKNLSRHTLRPLVLRIPDGGQSPKPSNLSTIPHRQKLSVSNRHYVLLLIFKEASGRLVLGKQIRTLYIRNTLFLTAVPCLQFSV
jgi:hypothetical protein